MKKQLVLLLGLMVLVTNCTSRLDEFNDEWQQSEFRINIYGSISQQYASKVSDEGFSDGDQIGLYGVNYIDNNSAQGSLSNEDNQVNNAKYKYSKESDIWISNDPIYYKDDKTNIDLYAYYPYGSPEDVRDYKFEVKSDQTGESIADGYSLSDFLWGMAVNVSPSSDKVKIRFSHRLSCVNVFLVEGEGFADGEFDALQKAVLITNTKHNASIDLSSGEVTAIGDISSEGIAMRSTNQGFRAIVVPQNIAANTSLFAITINGIAYNFRYDENISFNAGKQSKFTIKVNKKSMEGEYEFNLMSSEIVNWIEDVEIHAGEARQYFVVKQEIPGTLGKLIRAEKKNPNKIKNLKISGKIDVRDFGFMRDSMEILQAINLKECTIEPGWSWRLFLNTGKKFSLFFSGKIPLTGDERWKMALAEYPELNNYKDFGSENPKEYCNDEIPDEAFYNKLSLIYFSFPEEVTKIGKMAFYNTMLSGALVMPNKVTKIGENAFSSTNINSLELSNNITSIDSYAFSNCTSLAGTLSLPESLENLGAGAFSNCSLLSGTLSVPSKIKEIPRACFYECGFTGDLVIPEGIVRIGEEAFSGNSQLNGTLSLPYSLKEIGNLAFYGCKLQGELLIPSQLISIPNGCFTYNEFSSVVFSEDSDLVEIGGSAFYDNWRLSESITFPKNLMTIGGSAFSGCRTITKIIIPSTVSTIGDKAFYGCYGLSSIISNVVIPPTLGSNAFDGVGKDNFTLEVPEQSVARYQSSVGWSDFRRISAHHDFSISRSTLRVLNAKYSKTYVLRVPSNYSWSVKNKPEWVNISPSSGVGKTEVTITVDEMTKSDVTDFKVIWKNDYGVQYSKNYSGRSGEIVFSLDDKEYTSTMKVEQYDYNHYDGEVIVNQKASKGKGVNIVFMGDCFDAKDIAEGKYLDGINEAIGYYFDIEPYKSYKDYFNIYTVVGMSDDSGVGTVNTIKDAKFGSQYTLKSGVHPDESIAFEYAMKAETINKNNLNQSLVVMVENTTDYGGVCYMWTDGSAIAVCPMSRDAYPFDFRGLVQHEAGGHGFAKLADEYIYHNEFIESCGCSCCSHLDVFMLLKSIGWYRNLSINGDMKTVEWSHLIFHPDYSNIVDMYEGGFFHSRGIYRSEAITCMNNNIPYYSAIQRQEMVERIKLYAGEEFSIEEFYAKDIRDASNNKFTRSNEFSTVERASAGKQKVPQIMGDKPKLK